MANKIHDAFENVTADSELKESTREFLSIQRRKRSSFYLPPSICKILAVACMLTILLCGAGGYAGYSWLFTPVSYVSIDVNPSVELALNRLDRVISVSAYNAQGEELLEGLSLRGKEYTQAIRMITASNVLRKYLAADEEIVLTVAADSSRETALKSGVDQCCRHIGRGSRSVSVALDLVTEAHGNGLSVGKYSAYLKLSEYDDTVTIDECRDMSMAEIHCRIIEHEHSSGHNGNDSEQAHDRDMETNETNDPGNSQAQTSERAKDGETDDKESKTQGHGHQHRKNHGNHE